MWPSDLCLAQSRYCMDMRAQADGSGCPHETDVPQSSGAQGRTGLVSSLRCAFHGLVAIETNYTFLGKKLNFFILIQKEALSIAQCQPKETHALVDPTGLTLS